MSRLAEGKRVLEIGAYQGRSTAALAQTASLVVSVDHHRGDAGTRAVGTAPDWTLPLFCGHLNRLGLWEKVVPIIGNVEDIRPILAPFAFDLVWIDGAHDEESVSRDTALAFRVLNPVSGVIAWHDWDYESVQAGVAKHLVNLASVRQQPGTRIGTYTRGD